MRRQLRLAAAAGQVDPWVAIVVAANLVQLFACARAYPEQRYDPDLLAYFVYFRNWLTGDPSLQGAAFFMLPKALLVFGLGPLGDPSAAFYCTAAASATLGGIVYTLARDYFGRLAALVVSAFLLLDPARVFLSLRSSADIYLALFLFAAVLLEERGRLLAAAGCVLLSALVKPVTLPCALYFLTVQGAGRRRWVAAALPLLAIPATAWSNQVLLGGHNVAGRFFAEFTVLRGGESVGMDNVLHFALWTQLVKDRFAATAAWGVIGLLLWVAGDRRRLVGPLILTPLLFLSGYVILGAVSPFMPFYRFFWPLEIWFLMFVVYGALEGARRLAGGSRRMEVAVAGVVFWLLLDGYAARQVSYRRDVAMVLERGVSFARAVAPELEARRNPGERILVPMALEPYLLWEIPALRIGDIVTAEQAALETGGAAPEWIVHAPRLYASDAATQRVPQIVAAGGYEVVASDGEAVLLARPQAAR